MDWLYPCCRRNVTEGGAMRQANTATTYPDPVLNQNSVIDRSRLSVLSE